MLLITTYHYIRPRASRPKGIFPVTIEELLEQVMRIGRQCEFVSLSQVESGNLPTSSPSCLVSFDDGLQEQFHAYELLNSHGIPSAICVPTMYLETGKAMGVHKVHTVIETLGVDVIKEQIDLFIRDRRFHWRHYEDACVKGPILYKNDAPDVATIKFFMNFSLAAAERDALVNVLFDNTFGEFDWVASTYMTRAQIQAAAATGSLGAHGHTHQPLALLSRSVARNDMLRSKELLEQLADRQVNTISYPYGRGEALADWVYIEAEACGFVCGLTMERGINCGSVPTLNMRRFDCNELHGGRRSLVDSDQFMDRLVSEELWST